MVNGPQTYDFGNKRQYRRTLWNRIEERLVKPRKDTVVVILDDVEAGESQFLLERGYRPEHIHAVNYGHGDTARARAIAATINGSLRREGYSHVHAMGCSLSVALQRLKNDGVTPDAINADFCANVNLNSLDELAEMKAHLPAACVLSVNMLKGREREEWKKPYEFARAQLPDGSKDHAGDFVRYSLQWDKLRGAYDSTLFECAHHADNVCFGSYRSRSGQTMLWWVGRIREHLIACRDNASLMLDMVSINQIRQKHFRMTHAWLPLCVQMAAIDARNDFSEFAASIAWLHDKANESDLESAAILMPTPNRCVPAFQQIQESASNRERQYAQKVFGEGRSLKQLHPELGRIT